MSLPEKKARYRSFGLTIESEFSLPELRLIDGNGVSMDDISPDVVMTRQPLEVLWHELAKVNEYLAVSENLVLIRVPDTAIFCIKDGHTIEVSPYPLAEEDKIRLYLLGSCMGILLLQKRILPLHGSAVAINGQAYAIVGSSGAGKSTLSSYLAKRGHGLLSDDLIAVHVGEGGTPIAMPAYPQQKIWQESMQLLGKSTTGLKPIFQRETKFAVPVEGSFLDTPLPLAGVFELAKHDNEAGIVPIEGLERFHALLRHTFRGFLLEPLGLMEWHFRTLTKFAGRIDMHRLSRPLDGDSLADLYRLMVQSTQKEMLL